MIKIVIVEDRIKRGISLAKQFVEFAGAHPEFGIEITAICYFCSTVQKREETMRDIGPIKFPIEVVNIGNFKEVLDRYYSDEHTFVVMDYMLDGDGSEGIPVRRVNIRYARNNDRKASNRLWFYTATGSDNQKVMADLVGENHIFDVVEVDDAVLHIDLNNGNFMTAIQNVNPIGA